MSASTTNQMLPADVTPAMAVSPSFATKIEVGEEIQRLYQDADAIWMDIVAMCPGIDPALRSFMCAL